MTPGPDDGVLIDTWSDDDLVRAAQAGSTSAFDGLYRRYLPLAVSGANRHLRQDSRSHAEDVAQITFSAIYQALRRGHGPSGPFRSYLLLSVRREARRFIRRLDRDAGADATSVQMAVPADIDPAVEALRLGRSIVDDESIGAAYATLSPRFQDVLWLSEVLGLPPGDIGAAIGLSANAAAALSYRARAALRRSYNELEART